MKRRETRPTSQGSLKTNKEIKGRCDRIGPLTYVIEGGIESKANLLAPTEGTTFDVTSEVTIRQYVSGIYITSHRPLYFHQAVEQIPTKVQSGEVLLNWYLANLRNFYGSHRIKSPSFTLKEALSSLVTFGYGNQVVKQTRRHAPRSRASQIPSRTCSPQP